MLTLLPLFALNLCLFGQTPAAAPPPASPQEEPAVVPDLTTFDRQTLQTLCEQLYRKIAQLELQIQGLQVQLDEKDAQELAAASDELGDDAPASALENTWIVSVQSNAVPDLQALRNEISERSAAISPQEQRLQEQVQQLSREVNHLTADADRADNEADDKEDAKSTYIQDGESIDRRTTQYDYSESERRAARRDADTLRATRDATARQLRQAETELRNATRRRELDLLRLTRQLEQNSSVRRLTGVTADGLPVTVVAAGNYLELGKSLQVGKTYRITGRGQFTDTAGVIHLKSAAPVDASTDVQALPASESVPPTPSPVPAAQ